MPFSAMVRKSSQEVWSIDPGNRPFRPPASDPDERARWDVFWEQHLDVNIPDGRFVMPGGHTGRGINLPRTLNFAKHYVAATNTVRNSTQAEIDTYQAFDDADQREMDVRRADEEEENHPVKRRRNKSHLRELKFQIDRTNAVLMQVKSDIMDFQNLQDLKDRASNWPTLNTNIDIDNMLTRQRTGRRNNRDTD